MPPVGADPLQAGDVSGARATISPPERSVSGPSARRQRGAGHAARQHRTNSAPQAPEHLAAAAAAAGQAPARVLDSSSDSNWRAPSGGAALRAHAGEHRGDLSAAAAAAASGVVPEGGNPTIPRRKWRQKHGQQPQPQPLHHPRQHPQQHPQQHGSAAGSAPSSVPVPAQPAPSFASAQHQLPQARGERARAALPALPDGASEASSGRPRERLLTPLRQQLSTKWSSHIVSPNLRAPPPLAAPPLAGDDAFRSKLSVAGSSAAPAAVSAAPSAAAAPSAGPRGEFTPDSPSLFASSNPFGGFSGDFFASLRSGSLAQWASSEARPSPASEPPVPRPDTQ